MKIVISGIKVRIKRGPNKGKKNQFAISLPGTAHIEAQTVEIDVGDTVTVNLSDITVERLPQDEQ